MVLVKIISTIYNNRFPLYSSVMQLLLPNNNNRRIDMKDLPQIGTRLIRLGMGASLLGFGYIEYAVRMVYANPLAYYTGKRIVFKRICSEFGISRDKASRCMQYAINTAWKHPGCVELRNIFPSHTREQPPRILEFVYGIALHMYNMDYGDYFTSLVRRTLCFRSDPESLGNSDSLDNNYNGNRISRS